MGFCQWPEMVSKVGFLGAKVGENGSRPTFLPSLDPSRDIGKHPFLTHFEGVEIVFQKGP